MTNYKNLESTDSRSSAMRNIKALANNPDGRHYVRRIHQQYQRYFRSMGWGDYYVMAGLINR